MDDFALPAPVRELCLELHKAGFGAWIVGGCVRDRLLGRPLSDWDVATSATPQQVQKTFRRVIPTGIEHGTVTVLLQGMSLEVTTLRSEGPYTDGRRPDRVDFHGDIEADLARRDFTINAIAYEPLAARLIDPFGGVGDLRARCIRAVGDPRARFQEDGLRVVRALRFAAVLDFAIDPDTREAIPSALQTLQRVSGERIRVELFKAILAPKPSLAFAPMRDLGLLPLLLRPMEVFLRASALDPDAVWQRSMARIDALEAGACDRWAALLWDVAALSETEARPRPALLEEWMRALRFSNQEKNEVQALLAARAHALPRAGEVVALRRWMRAVGKVYAERVLALWQAEAQARADAEAPAELTSLQREVEGIVSRNEALETRDLALGGRELMTALGMAAGPEIGRMLERLLDAVIARPELNRAESLLALAREGREGKDSDHTSELC